MQFGTDGVRGVAGTELTTEFVHRLGRAAARVLSVSTTTRSRSSSAVTPASRPRYSTQRCRRVSLSKASTSCRSVSSRRRWWPSRPNVSERSEPSSRPRTIPTRQRDQAVRTRRAQAHRRRRAPHRSRTRHDRGRRRSMPRSIADVVRPRPCIGTTCSRYLEGRRLDGLRIVLDAANGAAYRGRPVGPAGGRRRGRRDRRDHPTGATSTTGVARPCRRTSPRRSASTAPTSASRSTVTPIA